MSDINKQIDQRVSAFVQELTALVKQAAIAAVSNGLGTSGGGGKRAAGRALAVGKPAGRIRRSANQIAAGVASVLGFIKSHPNSTSEVIRVELGMPRPVVRDALDRLMEGKKIKMKGMKRAATYAAA